MEAATVKITGALKAVEQAGRDQKARLTASKRVFRAIWELRSALREVKSLSMLRENAAQAHAWDAIEMVLSSKSLVVSEALRGSVCEAVVLLYAAGDAGGQLYACYRGLHELCGDEKKSLVGRSTGNGRSLGSRCASFEAMGALCAAYGGRLGSSTLAEARSRLSRHATRAAEAAARASALRALADATSSSPAESLIVSAQKNAASGSDLVKMVANRAGSEKSSEVRFATAIVLKTLAQRASAALGVCVAKLASASAEDAEKQRAAEKKIEDDPKKADRNSSQENHHQEGRRSPTKNSVSRPRQAKLRAEAEAASGLVDSVFDLATKWLGDDCLAARVAFAEACAVALEAKLEAARATRDRLSAASARADDADNAEDVEQPAQASGASSVVAAVAQSSASTVSASQHKRSLTDRVMGGARKAKGPGTANQGIGSSLVASLRWVAGAMAKAATEGDRKVLSGLSVCAGALLESQRLALADRKTVSQALMAFLSPDFSGRPAASSDHVDAVRSAFAFALRDGLCAGSSDRARRELLGVTLSLARESHASPLAIELCVSTAAYLVHCLGAAIPAAEADAAQKLVIDIGANSPAPGCRGRGVDLAVALAQALENRRANLARTTLRASIDQHHILVDAAVCARPGAAGQQKRYAGAQARDCLDGMATVASALLYVGGKSSELPWSLQDEALAVGESLVTRQFDASLFRDTQGTTALVCCVRCGWAIIGALASDASFLARRADRVVHALDRGLEFDQEDDDKLDANHQLACLEAAIGCIAKFQTTNAESPDVPPLLARVVRSTVRVGRSATPRLYRLVAAATLEVYASLPRGQGSFDTIPDEDLSNAFRWTLTLFKEVAAPLESSDQQACSSSSSSGFDTAPPDSGSKPDDDSDEDDELATTTLSFLTSRELVDDFELLGLVHRAEGNGVGDEAAAAALAAARLGASDRATACLAVTYLSPASRASTYFGAKMDDHSIADWLRPSSHSCALAFSTTSSSRQRQQKVTSQLVTVRLVDAVVRCLCTLAPSRRPETQSQALELVAATLVAALQAALPKPGKTAALLQRGDDDLRRRERRHAVAAVNASAALLALVASLDSWSAAHFTDSPRDALARGLASASPRVRRFSAHALALLISKLTDVDDKRAAATRALVDAASKTDAPRSGADAARRSGAACAVACLAASGHLSPDRALETLRKPLSDATPSARGHPLPRAWTCVALAQLIRSCYARRPMTEAAGRQLVGSVLDALETQLASAAFPELRAGLDDEESALELQSLGRRPTPTERLVSEPSVSKYSQHWTNALGIEDASVAFLAISRCLVALAPVVRRLRQRGPDAPLAQRYAALCDALIVRTDEVGGIEAAPLSRAALAAYAALAPSYFSHSSGDGGDIVHNRFALLKAHALCACLGVASRAAHAPRSLSEAAAAVRCLRALVTSAAESSDEQLIELVARTAKLGALAVLDTAVAAEAAHPLCVDDKRRAEAADASGASSRVLKALVDSDKDSRVLASWLHLPSALNALAEDATKITNHEEYVFSVLLGGRLFCRRTKPPFFQVIDRLADYAYPSALFAADDLDDGLAQRDGQQDDEDDLAQDEEEEAAALGTRAAVLECANLDAAIGLDLALGRQPAWRVKLTTLWCATHALRNLDRASAHFDVAAATQIVDDFRASASRRPKLNTSAAEGKKRKLAVARATAESLELRRRVPDLVALRLDEIVGLGCAAAAATVGDDAPLEQMRAAGLDLLRLLVNRFAVTPDPEGGLALGQYTSQLASALRATLGPGSSLAVAAKARDLFLRLCRVSLLDDPTQTRRLVKLHLTPALSTQLEKKGTIRPSRDNEKFSPHSSVLDHLERLATVAQLRLLIADKPERPETSYFFTYSESSREEQLVFDVDEEEDNDSQTHHRALTEAARKALRMVLLEEKQLANAWRSHWLAACLDGARLAQGNGSPWPSMDKPRIAVGRLYDSNLDATQLRVSLHRFMPLWAAAAAQSASDDEPALLALSVAGLSSEQSRPRCKLWLAAIESLLSRHRNDDACIALCAVAQSVDESILPVLCRAVRLAPCATTALARALKGASTVVLCECLEAAALVEEVDDDLFALAVAAARKDPPDDDCSRQRLAVAPRGVMARKPNVSPALVALAVERAQKFGMAEAAAAVLESWVAGVSKDKDAAGRAAQQLGCLALLDDDDLGRTVFANVLAPLLPPRSTLRASRSVAAVLIPAILVHAKRRPDAPELTVAVLAAATCCSKGPEVLALVASCTSLDGLVADALLKVAKADPSLFRAAIALLPQDTKAKVETAVRAAASRPTATPAARTLAAPRATASIGLKIDMARYN